MTPCGDVITGCVLSPLIGLQVHGRAVCLLTSSQLAEKEGPRALPLKMRPSLPAQGAGLQEEIRQVVNPASSLLTLVVSWGSSSLQDQKEMTPFGKWIRVQAHILLLACCGTLGKLLLCALVLASVR